MLRRRLLAAVVTVVSFAPPQPAEASDPPPPVGRPCAFLVTEDVTADGGTVGQVTGGPLVVPGYDVSMRCSIKVDEWTHAGPSVASAATSPTPNVTVLAPTPVWYQAGDEYASVYLCTEATAVGTTWYRTDGAWSTDAASGCSRACQLYDECLFQLLSDVYELGEHLPEPVRDVVWDPVFGYVGCWWWGWYCPVLDEVLCASFRYLRPGVPGVVDIREDGDVYVAGSFFWDCPPYGEW